MLALIRGYKTYIVGFITILYAAVMFWQHQMDLKSSADMVLAALGLMGVRSGITTALIQILTVMGVPLPPNPGQVAVKQAVAAAAPVAQKVAPLLFVAVLVGGMLSMGGCASAGGIPTGLAIAEQGFTTAQVLYNSVCAANAGASFCSAKDMALANAAADTVRHAIEAAQAVIANGSSTSTQIAVAIQAVTTAEQDFERIVNLMQAKKAKAMAALAH